VFTARYGLSPYITQIYLVLARLNSSNKPTIFRRRAQIVAVGIQSASSSNRDGRPSVNYLVQKVNPKLRDHLEMRQGVGWEDGWRRIGR